jgi:hypothetical protein
MSKKIQIMNLEGWGVLESYYKKTMNNSLSGKDEILGQFWTHSWLFLASKELQQQIF